MRHEKHLLILTSSYPSDLNDGRAAAGFFVRDFAEKLAGRHKLSLMTQHTGEGAFEIQDKKFKVFRFSWPGKGRPLSTLRLPADIIPIAALMLAGSIAGIRFVRRKDIDHVIALWAIPCGIWALILKKFCNISYSIWCLGADIWDYQNSRLTRAILKLVLSNADHVYADGFELSRVVNNIVQVDCSFLPSSRRFHPPHYHRPLKPEHVRHYVFVGRYHHNKGPDILIKAIQLLPQELLSKIHCHLFGGGALNSVLEVLIEESGLANSITLGGFIGETKLMEVLYASDVIVIPSRQDSISLMLTAALQLNKVIIATNVGDTGYLLKKYNVGHIAVANSPESIANCIKSDLLLQNDSVTGRNDLLKILDISNAVSQIVEDIED